MNLIVTCARHLETETEIELRDILEEMGDPETDISITEMSGILTAKTNLDPIKTTRKIREKILEEPWAIRYCLRIIPIQHFIKTDVENIEKTASQVSKEIQEGETYRILIEKRNSGLSSKDIITKTADKIRNKVSLEHADKIILIEIMGDRTGISVLREGDILSVEKTKRSISE